MNLSIKHIATARQLNECQKPQPACGPVLQLSRLMQQKWGERVPFDMPKRFSTTCCACTIDLESDAACLPSISRHGVLHHLNNSCRSSCYCPPFGVALSLNQKSHKSSDRRGHAAFWDAICGAWDIRSMMQPAMRRKSSGQLTTLRLALGYNNPMYFLWGRNCWQAGS